MKGIYLSEEGKKEIEDKISELEKAMERNREISSIFYALSGRNLMLKEILSSATILPVEKNWAYFVQTINPIYNHSNLADKFYPNGVIIQSKQ